MSDEVALLTMKRRLEAILSSLLDAADSIYLLTPDALPALTLGNVDEKDAVAATCVAALIPGSDTLASRHFSQLLSEMSDVKSLQIRTAHSVKTITIDGRTYVSLYLGGWTLLARVKPGVNPDRLTVRLAEVWRDVHSCLSALSQPVAPPPAPTRRVTAAPPTPLNKMEMYTRVTQQVLEIRGLLLRDRRWASLYEKLRDLYALLVDVAEKAGVLEHEDMRKALAWTETMLRRAELMLRQDPNAEISESELKTLRTALMRLRVHVRNALGVLRETA